MSKSASRCGLVFESPTSLAFAMAARIEHEAACETCASLPLGGAAVAEKNAEMWHQLAVAYGYNELVKQARNLGEKVYFRLGRDHAEQEAAKLGAKINRGGEGNVVLELTTKPPFITFRERDIELMRAAVAAFDVRAASAVPG